MSGSGQQQFTPGAEQLDSGLGADFEELVQRTVDPGVKKVLQRNQAKLLSNGITSEQAIQALSREDIVVCGLKLGDAAVLKLAFPSPAAAGAGGAAGGSGAAQVSAMGSGAEPLGGHDAGIQLMVRALDRTVMTVQNQAEVMDKLVKVMTVRNHLEAVDKFRYTTSQATQYRDPGFKDKLAQAYDAIGRDGNLRCSLTGAYVPKGLVCAAHLFKYAWRSSVEAVLGFTNINDVRNGLLLLKPFEEAFDNGYLVFEYQSGDEEGGGDDGRFVAHWLGSDDLQVLNYNGYPWKGKENTQPGDQATLRSLLMGRTFKSFDGTSLTFSNNLRPYKRCLAFQARIAIRQAINEGRINELWTAGKNFKTHSPTATNMEEFLAKMPQDGPDAPVEVGSVEEVVYDGSDIAGGLE